METVGTGFETACARCDDPPSMHHKNRFHNRSQQNPNGENEHPGNKLILDLDGVSELSPFIVGTVPTLDQVCRFLLDW